MTLPQPEIYRDYEIIPEINYLDIDDKYTGKSDWIITQVDDPENSRWRPYCTLEEVKESIDDLLNQ